MSVDGKLGENGNMAIARNPVACKVCPEPLRTRKGG